MNDVYLEFKEYVKKEEKLSIHKPDPKEFDIEKNNKEDKFAVSIKNVQEKISELKSNTTKIEKCGLKMKSAVTEDKQQKIRKKVTLYIEKSNEDNTTQRMRENNYKAVAISFYENLKIFQSVQVNFKDKVQAKIVRFVKTLDENIEPQKVQELIQDPKQLQDMLEQKILHKGSNKLRYALEDIQAKYQDIIRLEIGVKEVARMFEDAKLLMMEQGEMIDLIEIELEKAKNYTERGVKHLKKAKKKHKTIRCRMICIIFIGLLIIIAITIPFIIKYIQLQFN